MDQEIEKLTQSFAKDIPNRAEAVQKELDQVLASLEGGGAVRWDALEAATHKLAGSSGTYGFLQLSAVCGFLEEQVGQARFKSLARGALVSHLKRWSEIFAEQWQLASRREKPFERPDQLVDALKRHLESVSGGKAA